MSEFAGTTWTVIGLTLLPTALAHQLLPVTSLSQSAPNRTHARVRESLCAFVALRDSARVAQTASLISLAAVGTTERPSVTMAGADASKKVRIATQTRPHLSWAVAARVAHRQSIPPFSLHPDHRGDRM